MTAYVLMHSPLVGPATWAPVARRLPGAVVPSLLGRTPFWPVVAATVAAAVAELPAGEDVVLVAHSNAGRFVPVAVDAIDREVTACVFVDASLPGGAIPAAAMATIRSTAVDGRAGPWSQWFDEADVAALFPDEATRRAVAAEEPRLPLAFFEQIVPVPDGWDDRPCGYLRFGAADAAEARERGWRVAHLDGRHLHQLVDPDAVTAAIVELGK